MKKHSGYMTRALQAQDPRFARILGKLGHTAAGDLRAAVEPIADELGSLREEYFQAVGKRAFHGWDADALREKIAATKAQS